jgi:hypothetical protein
VRTAASEREQVWEAPLRHPGSRFSLAETAAVSRPALLRVLAVLAVSLLTGACTPAASPALSAARSPVPTAAASEAVPVEAYDHVGVGWESQFVFMEPSGLGAIKGLIASGPGFVLWSDEKEGRPGFLVGSGVTGWEQVDSTLSGRTILAVVDDGSGLTALVGRAKGPIERWRSANGRSWEQVATTGIDGLPAAMAVTSTGFVAVGVDRTGCSLASWTSPDAVAWAAAGTLPGGPGSCAGGQGSPTIEVLLAGTDGLLVAGHLSATEPATWTSSDYRSWQRGAAPASGAIAAIATAGSGYVAVGHDAGTPAGAAVWTSPDGASWVPVHAQAAFAGATMTAVVTLADGSLVSVGEEPRAAGGSVFAAWTSTDGRAWQRSPNPLCLNLDVCDATGPGPALLARNGDRLVAYDGSLNILSSPPVTAGLRPGALELHLDGLPAGAWSTGAVVGYCAPADDASGGLQFGAAYPRLLDVGAAAGTSSFIPSLQLALGRDLSLQLLAYDRGDDAGFRKEALNLEPGASVADLGQVTINPGSTPIGGRLEFHDLPIGRTDPNLPAIAPVSGWLAWKCG